MKNNYKKLKKKITASENNVFSADPKADLFDLYFKNEHLQDHG